MVVSSVAIFDLPTYSKCTSRLVIGRYIVKTPLPSSYLFPTELVTKVRPNVNSVEVHPQPSNNEHPVDGALVGAGPLWPKKFRVFTMVYQCRCWFTQGVPPSASFPCRQSRYLVPTMQ